MMNNSKIGILDRALRDGGYANDWKWGFLDTERDLEAVKKMICEMKYGGKG